MVTSQEFLALRGSNIEPLFIEHHVILNGLTKMRLGLKVFLSGTRVFTVKMMTSSNTARYIKTLTL
jgi:hypothetical protein